MVPFEATEEEDISVTIECNFIVAGVSGQAPIIKGRLWGQVDPSASSWQLESQPHQFRPSRERTMSTTSVTSATSTSTHSSFAFISDPEISSSFAASLENRDASPSPALSSSPSERSSALHQNLSAASHRLQPVSPRHRGYTGKLLTLHLEKSQTVIWPSLIVGPAPDAVSSVRYLNTTVSAEIERQYNMDPTSLTLIALELIDIRKNKEEAFECFVWVISSSAKFLIDELLSFRRAWHLARAPMATMKLVSCYFPIYPSFDIPDNHEDDVQRGTLAYYLQCIGGRPGLAQLYIEAGMLYLEGTASGLISSSHSSLSSIRMPLPPYGSAALGHSFSGTEAWRRDRTAAARLFERARILQPGLETPMLPLSGPGSTEELAFGMHNRRRGGKQQEDLVKAEEGGRSLVGKAADVVDSTWYMLPGLVGAGTALVVVGVVGVLSFSWSRRNQGT
ncbi:hypothetical protein GGU10DRAFT_350049 [Lentinula aff. detonsa]|uniref:CS domain-containing protein n=1 Tax=Lentinula aff. detonsa TaxID=2804958 RepID=A0AA38KRP9_9AGAR|nr:hypothetical protein GGU10DRAFT_350049 [Lentinula aff. detonsa]